MKEEYILYGCFLAINRCSKIIRESPDGGYNIAILREFEKLKQQLENDIKRTGQSVQT